MMQRYSAKLLFQWRVVTDNRDGKMRTCEERIITFSAPSPTMALKHAKSRGKKSELNYQNDQGNSVFFEFIGVVDLIHLGVECDSDEVWYDIRDHLAPMERKKKLIPSDKALVENTY